MNKTWKRHTAVRVAGLLTLLASSLVAAMPPLARKYEVACNTCHIQPPQLNAFGEAFRNNGYQWPERGDELGKIKDTPIVMAAEAYREAWPDAFLPSDIPHLPAVGFQVAGAASYAPPNPQGNVSFSGAGVTLAQPGAPFDRRGQLDLSALNEGLDLFIIGRAAPDTTLFAELGFYSPDMRFAIERAEIVRSNILPHLALNAKVGRFEPDVSFTSGFRKLVGNNYDISSRTLGQPSGWALEPAVNQTGLELNGVVGRGRVRYNAAVLAPYTGVPASLGGSPAGVANNSLDSYLHLETKLGGLRLDGVEEGAAVALQEPWVDNALWLGAYAYHGNHEVDLSRAYSGFGATGTPAALAPNALNQSDEFWREGGDVKLTRGSVWLIFAFATERHHLSAAGGLSASSVSGQFASLEAEYILFPWLVPYLTVDYYHGDNPYLVNGGWGAVQAGSAATPLSASSTPAKITEWTLRPAVSVHLYMNWKLFARAEFAKSPLKSDLQTGQFKLANITVGTKLAF